jgi:hypothetical protein
VQVHETKTLQSPQQFGGVAEIMQALKDVAEVADKRASTFLLSLGTVLLTLSFLAKVKPFGLPVADMQPSEFISLLVICLGCLLSGAYVRMLQERLTNDHELRMLETALRYSTKSQKETIDAATTAQEIAMRPIPHPLEPGPRPPGG